jgi:hypothetical protein
MSCRISSASSSQGARRGLAPATLPTRLLILPTFLPTLASRPERSGNAWQRAFCGLIDHVGPLDSSPAPRPARIIVQRVGCSSARRESAPRRSPSTRPTSCDVGRVCRAREPVPHCHHPAGTCRRRRRAAATRRGQGHARLAARLVAVIPLGLFAAHVSNLAAQSFFHALADVRRELYLQGSRTRSRGHALRRI